MPGRRYFSTNSMRVPIKVQPHQGRFATLPGDVDHCVWCASMSLADVLFQQSIIHAELATGVQGFFIQEKAVGAVQVAGRAGGFREQVKGRWSAGCSRRKGGRDSHIKPRRQSVYQ
jgi:hypothetical protein